LGDPPTAATGGIVRPIHDAMVCAEPVDAKREHPAGSGNSTAVLRPYICKGSSAYVARTHRQRPATKVRKIGRSSLSFIGRPAADESLYASELWAWLDQPFTGPPTVLIASQAVLDLG
jgi:hypothetical protein